MAKAAATAAAAERVQAEAAEAATEMAAALGGSPSPDADSSPSPPAPRAHQRPSFTVKMCSTPGCNLQANHLGGHLNEIEDTPGLSPPGGAGGGTGLKTLTRRKRNGAVAKNAQLRSRSSPLVHAPLSPHVVGWETFSQLPPAEMHRLSQLLPEIDQPEDHWAQEPSPSPSPSPEPEPEPEP